MYPMLLVRRPRRRVDKKSTLRTMLSVPPHRHKVIEKRHSRAGREPSFASKIGGLQPTRDESS